MASGSGNGSGYRPGGFYRCCDVCGFDYRASETFKRWDGLYVCASDWEPRHPQDFVRGRADRQNVPDPRPEPPPVFQAPAGGPFFLIQRDGSNTLSIEIFATSQITVYAGAASP